MASTNAETQYRYRRTRNGTINDRMYSAKTRARERGYDCNLTLQSLVEVWEQQKGNCALSGVELGYVGTGWCSASLDRIDPDKGYTIDNVQWVAWRVNDSKSNMKNEDFITMCKAIVISHNKENK